MTDPEHQAKNDFADWHRIAEVLATRVCADDAASVAGARNVARSEHTNLGFRVIGISGSQGSGKSTVAKILVQHLQQRGLNAASASLDDFYLTQAQRIELAASVHPLLRTRGVPGTHDTDWLQRVLAAMQAADSAHGSTIDLPMFDKAVDDRCGQRQANCQVLVLEGWCLGVQAQPAELLVNPMNELERAEDAVGVWRRWVNEQAKQRYEPLWHSIDYWLQLRPPGFEQVVQWRGQQEQQIELSKRMDTAALQRFIHHYERLTRWQWECPPWQPGLCVALAANHQVDSVQQLQKG